jgi:hypothetical protein
MIPCAIEMCWWALGAVIIFVVATTLARVFEVSIPEKILQVTGLLLFLILVLKMLVCLGVAH